MITAPARVGDSAQNAAASGLCDQESGTAGENQMKRTSGLASQPFNERITTSQRRHEEFNRIEQMRLHRRYKLCYNRARLENIPLTVKRKIASSGRRKYPKTGRLEMNRTAPNHT